MDATGDKDNACYYYDDGVIDESLVSILAIIFCVKASEYLLGKDSFLFVKDTCQSLT